MRAVILCDGEPPFKKSLERALKGSDLFIAADGGAEVAFKFRMEPDVIIGDLDSYTITGKEKARIIHDPDQDTNDLEKALSYARTHSVDEVIIFGATGKRVDHTLKNLSVLLQFNPSFRRIKIKDRRSEMFFIKSPFQMELPVGTSISLFPISGKVENITSEGLKYPLRKDTLENGIMDGTSNQTTQKRFEIKFKKGDLLLLINLEGVQF